MRRVTNSRYVTGKRALFKSRGGYLPGGGAGQEAGRGEAKFSEPARPGSQTSRGAGWLTAEGEIGLEQMGSRS